MDVNQLLILSNAQRQAVYKYVEDKTYVNRIGFTMGVAGLILSIGFIMLLGVQGEIIEVLLTSLLLVLTNWKSTMSYRHIKNEIFTPNATVVKKRVHGRDVEEKNTVTVYNDINSKNGTLVKDFRQTIKKYYIIGQDGLKYECINYLNYKECLSRGEFISITLSTGEKYAIYK